MVDTAFRFCKTKISSDGDTVVADSAPKYHMPLVAATRGSACAVQIMIASLRNYCHILARYDCHTLAIFIFVLPIRYCSGHNEFSVLLARWRHVNNV